MVEGRGEPTGGSSPADRWWLEERLGAWGWGLFFVWIGIAFLWDLGWGLGFLGVGVITLGIQLFRLSCGLGAEGLWMIVGLLFFAGGLWELLLESDFPMVPIVFVLLGAGLIWSAVRGKRPGGPGDAYNGPPHGAT